MDGAIALFGTLLTIIVAFFRIHSMRYESRIARFTVIRKNVEKNRYGYSTAMRHIYAKRDNPELICDNLITMRSWNLTKEPILIRSKDEDVPDAVCDEDFFEVRPGKTTMMGPEHTVFFDRKEIDDSTSDVKGDKIVRIRGARMYPSVKDSFRDMIWNRQLPETTQTYSTNVRRHLKKVMFNGELYAISRIAPVEDVSTGTIHPRFTLYRSDYFSYFNTCEYISHFNSQRIDEGYSPRPVDLGDYGNRIVAAGICTLTIIRNLKDGSGTAGDYFLVHHRSEELAEASSTISMIPAGSFTPLVISMPKGTEEGAFIVANVRREFEEELFGHSEVEYPDKYRPYDFKGCDRHYFLTMGFDPLSTKIEMITLMTLDASNDDFWSLIDAECRRMGRSLPEEDRNLDGLNRFLNESKSSEGKSIQIVKYTKDNLSRFSDNMKAMPVFREAMAVMKEYHGRYEELVPSN